MNNQLKPEHVILPEVAANEAAASGVISTIGAFATLTCAEATCIEAGSGNTLVAAALWTGTIVLACLNIRSAWRARSFRERDLELRGLPKEH